MKKFLLPAFALAYAAALALSLLITLKPGAAIFYLKITLEPEKFQHSEGFAYRYPVKLPPAIFPPDRALIFENEIQLARKNRSEVIRPGGGVFATRNASAGGYNLYLAPQENSNPAADGKTYRLYSANIFFSRTMGILYFSGLLFGVFHLAAFALNPNMRRQLRSLPGWLQVSSEFIQRCQETASGIRSRAQSPGRAWLADGFRLLVFTAAAAYGLIFMEWLFQVTKPSFMDRMSLGQKVELFLLSGLALAAVNMLPVLVLLLSEYLLRPLRLAWLAACAAATVPAALLTALIVLWLDHFTYTIFRFGILTAAGLGRTAYGVLISLTWLAAYRRLLAAWGLIGSQRMAAGTFKLFSRTVVALLVVASSLAILRAEPQAPETHPSASLPAARANLPHIILIGSDGISARNMSVYGYARDTTPQINRLAQGSLVAENAFTNDGKTYGSITSILNSKAPAGTRVIVAPDVLQGADAYQHLPGILKELGYTTAQIGLEYHVDAYTTNMKEGFDLVNQRSARQDWLTQGLHELGYDLPAYFISAVMEPMKMRLSQALYIDTFANPFTVVNQPDYRLDDARRMDDLFTLLEETEKPLFVHVHLMVTHGPRFTPDQQAFSHGLEQNQDWMTAFYDDAILTYDQYIGGLVQVLRDSGELDNTILILYADHAINWGINERIPLIIHFPNDQYQGRIQANAQNLDIAPTILDYLGQPIPDWMEGRSLLHLRDQRREPLFTVSVHRLETPGETGASQSNANPTVVSRYPFSIIQIADCQRWHRLDLRTNQWTFGDFSQHTAPCPEDALLNQEQIRQALITYLAALDYDTSYIP